MGDDARQLGTQACDPRGELPVRGRLGGTRRSDRPRDAAHRASGRRARHRYVAPSAALQSASASAGVAADVVPVYLAEIAPSEQRGALVTVNNLGITFGQFVSYLVTARPAPQGEQKRLRQRAGGLGICVRLERLAVHARPGSGAGPRAAGRRAANYPGES